MNSFDNSPFRGPGGKIFLIGFMGSGKTYWGSRWADRYKLPFIDLDERVAQRENKTVAEIFEQDGEEYFRQVETVCLQNNPGQDNFIMACGGGTACFNNNMQWMNENGTTVYLSVSPRVLFKRLMDEKDKRPLLKTIQPEELLSFIEQKLKERESFYRQAKIILPEDALNMESLRSLNLYTR